jgi:hypothetical protein
MIEDIGGDPTGKRHALLNALYYVSYAPFSMSPHLPRSSLADGAVVPFAVLGERTIPEPWWLVPFAGNIGDGDDLPGNHSVGFRDHKSLSTEVKACAVITLG